MRTILLKIINRLPNFVNLCLLSFNKYPNILYGRSYKDYRQFLSKQTHHYDPSTILIHTINRAIKEIPFYKGAYGNLELQSVREFEEIIKFIDKDTILKHYGEFISPKIKIKDFDVGTTGGTSGKPLQFIAPKNRYVVEMATMHSLWSRVGYNFHERATIRNHKLKNNNVYTINPITREFIFDGFRLNQEYFDQVYRVIKKYKIRFIHCYPSTAFEFSEFLLERKYDASFIKAFLCGSENIFDYQIDLIQNRLGVCRTFPT